LLPHAHLSLTQIFSLTGLTVPSAEELQLPKLAKRCQSCQPVKIIKLSTGEFLLCYNGAPQILPIYRLHRTEVISGWNLEFGLYVDRHGTPVRSEPVVEWTGTANRVAVHEQYLLLFDERFIEVRHLDTGVLVQIIAGDNVRCAWDGRGGPSEQERVHVVMLSPNITPGTWPIERAGSAQRLWELTQTA
jgi:RHO1 GDP-GTP exchange protein 1/2